MIKRKIDTYVQDFFEADKRALLLTGARQIGKTLIFFDEVQRALSNIMDVKEYHLQEALVLGNDNLCTSGKITYAPIYMMMFLQHQDSAPSYYKVDVSML